MLAGLLALVWRLQAAPQVADIACDLAQSTSLHESARSAFQELRYDQAAQQFDLAATTNIGFITSGSTTVHQGVESVAPAGACP